MVAMYMWRQVEVVVVVVVVRGVDGRTVGGIVGKPWQSW